MKAITETSIPAWTDTDERLLLSSLSQEVPDNGLILEIGCLYGGTTAVLALSNLKVRVISIDDFSWTPEGYPVASKARFEDNMKAINASNVFCMEGDSRILVTHWKDPIDLLWIDGGHSYPFVYSDLFNFSPFAKVIALHDYKNPAWETIEKAVNNFLQSHSEWYLDKVVGMICVLRRK